MDITIVQSAGLKLPVLLTASPRIGARRGPTLRRNGQHLLCQRVFAGNTVHNRDFYLRFHLSMAGAGNKVPGSGIKYQLMEILLTV